MRYTVLSAQDVDITFQNLLDTWLFTTGMTTANDVFARVKVRRVSVWAVPAIGGTTTVEVTFLGTTVGASGQGKTASDTSMGVQPAHVSLSPGKLTQAGQFQASSSDAAFQLICPQGAVVDVEATFQHQYGANPASQNALVGAAAGFIANRVLDGLAKATTQFLPVTDIVV